MSCKSHCPRKERRRLVESQCPVLHPEQSRP
ncbi:hypothetical protein ES319_D04G041600v1 [Gossypium barbadense]|uniref:Uncharacterized protein n=1 Tax=Gossypium barbadense TaxID=3634 RepID=A0A5J5RRH7_GOSBA|nr:hypothetical protein ES319_D04G041600v1 [Gossypium barbadense]